jgi:transglutaminase-like putative cysteine protease
MKMKKLIAMILTLMLIIPMSFISPAIGFTADPQPFIIKGNVRDNEGNTLNDMKISVVSKIRLHSMEEQKQLFESVSDENGDFVLMIPPTPYPTSIIKAELFGYYPVTVGKFGGASGEEVETKIILQKIGEEPDFRASSIDIRVCYSQTVNQGDNKPTPIPDYATLDKDLYPENILPYLESGKNLELTDKVQAVADEILDGVSDKKNAVEVAKGVYDWVCSHVEYTTRPADKDTIQKGQYSRNFRGFGTDFYDWCQTPEETIDYPWVICIEFERLATALLRCLDIPARPTPLAAHPVTQFWLEPKNGDGLWVNMETSNGRNQWVKGNDSALFPSKHDSAISIIPINSDAPMHAFWDLGVEGFWMEQPGQNIRLPLEDRALSFTKDIIKRFPQTGEIPQQKRDDGERPPQRPFDVDESNIEIQTINPAPKGMSEFVNVYWRGFITELTNATNMKPVFRFPHFLENEYAHQLDMAHFTNHPEAVVKVWNETETSDETGLSQVYYYIQFDLEKIIPTAEELQALPKELFDIVGVVNDKNGNPVENARVWLENGSTAKPDMPGDRFEKVASAETLSDENGEFILTGIPNISPRYMVGATADGYFKTIEGRIGKDTGVVEITLKKENEEEAFRTRKLRVIGAYLLREGRSPQPKELPEFAMLDKSAFPDEILPYLKDGKGYETTDTVKKIGDEILEEIPEEDRDNLIKVAYGVYCWVASHIEYDLVKVYPSDITCGNYQTTFGGFGIDFDDWCYHPQEAIEQGRTICIEFERLAVALCRYLGVPARSTPLKAHPVTQFWVQESEDGDGYWSNMETSKGRTEWKKGNYTAFFPSKPDSMIAIISPDENAPIHMSWDFGAECWWLEDYGGSQKLEGTPEKNLEDWEKVMDEFSETGKLPNPRGKPPTRPEDGHDGGVEPMSVNKEAPSEYLIYTRGFEIDLCNATDLHPVVKFPHFVENQWRDQLEISHYISIPGIVEKVWEETSENEETGLTQKWYCIRLDLTKIEAEPEKEIVSPDGENLILNSGFEDGERDWKPKSIGRDGGSAKTSIDSNNSQSGKKSAKITNDGDGLGIWNQLVPNIPSPAKVHLSGYIKTEDVKGFAFIDINILGKDIHNKPPFPATEPKQKGTSGWTKVEGTFDIPEGADAVIIGCTMLGVGTAWFDDVELKILEGETAGGTSENMEEVWIKNPSSGEKICTHIHKPAGETPKGGFPAVVAVPGGSSWGTQLDSHGRLIPSIVDAGFVTVVFDPEGRGKTGGEENNSGVIHQDGMHEVLKHVANLDYVDAENIGVLSMSFGLIMSGCTLGRFPLDPPVKYYIDWEGPDGSLCDYSGKHGKSMDIDENFWETREAYLFIEDFQGNYVRLQSEKDHVQKTNDNAFRMIEHATSTENGGKGKCNWTRMNGGDYPNPPNTVFSDDDPPNWISESVKNNDKMTIDTIKEMSAMPNPYDDDSE